MPGVPLPITAYLDGSGIHKESPILTLATCVIEDGHISRLESLWRETLKRHGLERLHMREMELRSMEPLFSDLANVFAELDSGFLYVRSCSVLLSDYRKAVRQNRYLPVPEVICLDYCCGGLTIPDADEDRPDTITIYFDPNEPFRKHMDQQWQPSRKRPDAGWPRQVRSIDTRSERCGGLEIADFIASTANRYLRRRDQPILGIISVACIRHASLVYDLKTILHSYDADGHLVKRYEPGFRPSTLTVQLK